MDGMTTYRPGVTIRELILGVLNKAPKSEIVSVKATIAAVREQVPQLPETDCELVAAIVEMCSLFQLGVAFDVKEP
ncbi:hypothetical protein [Mesorhizobium sp. WSM1293]|uniref:hypothetical protein n=1 Tax=Mesorhizobium sp. WSM1293 TaxID=1040984 RepID=UPI00048272C8|nr:hypothetical protein [Mesorhizobium sp. WSM1293]